MSVGEPCAGRGPAEPFGPAARISGGPLNIFVAIDDCEIAVGIADNLKLECVGLIRVGVEIADIVPGHREHVIVGVEIVKDPIRPRGISVVAGCGAVPSARVDVSPERGDDRIIEPAGNLRRRVRGNRAREGNAAVIVDVERGVVRAEEIQARVAKYRRDIDRTC